MYRGITFLGMVAVSLLVGCGQAATDLKLTLARNELRQECFANDTYSCRNKTIDFNIEVLESSDFKTADAKKRLVELFGDDAWDIYKDAVDETIAEGVELFDSHRPNIFARWFMGDSQPLSGKGYVMELAPHDLLEVDNMILKNFIEKARKAGLKVDPRVAAGFGYNTNAASHVPPKQDPMPAPKSDGVQNTEVPTPRLPGDAYSTVEQALQALVNDQTASDGGEEFTDGREILYVDLNDDGKQDAVVLFTIEGRGGAQNGYQTLAVFAEQPSGWQLRGQIVVNGSASNLKQESAQVVSITSLTQGPDDLDCCPSVQTPQTYKWLGNGFIEIPPAS